MEKVLRWRNGRYDGARASNGSAGRWGDWQRKRREKERTVLAVMAEVAIVEPQKDYDFGRGGGRENEIIYMFTKLSN